MSWQCRMVEGPGREVGDMWLTPQMVEKGHHYGYALSDEYRRDWEGKRPPLWVVLPGGAWFCVDSDTTNGHGGWKMTGEPPRITVSPSINLIGRYHGYIANGVISDDVEGRTFDAQPR